MLMTNDVGVLFASMRTVYGAQWKHGPEAVEVWRNALKEYEPEAIRKATTAILDMHIDYPPNLPQFLQIVEGPKKRFTTYLPPAPFNKANHDKAMRDMQRLKNMSAYRGI